MHYLICIVLNCLGEWIETIDSVIKRCTQETDKLKHDTDELKTEYTVLNKRMDDDIQTHAKELEIQQHTLSLTRAEFARHIEERGSKLEVRSCYRFLFSPILFY